MKFVVIVKFSSKRLLVWSSGSTIKALMSSLEPITEFEYVTYAIPLFSSTVACPSPFQSINWLLVVVCSELPPVSSPELSSAESSEPSEESDDEEYRSSEEDFNIEISDKKRPLKINNCNCDICVKCRECVSGYESYETYDPMVTRFKDSIKITCDKCGGNGYMKTSPDCYHTCLTCLGKGFVAVQKENIN